MVAATSTIEQHVQAASRSVDGCSLIVLTDDGEVLVLNASGTLLWQLLQRPQPVATLAARLGEVYRLEAERAMADTLAFVDTLAAVNAVTVR